MSSITQTIPSFVAGMSQQPDELMFPGQVKNLLNALPDLTDGLTKRNGSRLVDSLPNAGTGGVWFDYYRDEAEGAYIGQIRGNGQVYMYSVSDPNPVDSNGNPDPIPVIQSTAAEDYLNTNSPNDGSPSDLRFLTVNDYTFVTNPHKKITKGTATAPTRAKEFEYFLVLRQLTHGRSYTFNVAKANVADINETRVTRLSVEPNTSTESPSNVYNSDNPDGRRVGTEIFNETDSTGFPRNLAFRLTTTARINVPDNDSASEYVANYDTQVELLSGGTGWAVGDVQTVTMKGQQYRVTVEEVAEFKVPGKEARFRPKPTSFRASDPVDAQSILGQVTPTDDEINNNTGPFALIRSASNPLDIDFEVIGNGIYIGCDDEINVTTTEPDLWRIIAMTRSDTSDLPTQCKHGFITEITNSERSEEDSYYLRFKGQGNKDGAGTWEECAKPDIKTEFNIDRLPIVIIRFDDPVTDEIKFLVDTYKILDEDSDPVELDASGATVYRDGNGNPVDGNGNPTTVSTTHYFTKDGWAAREVGDGTTNPYPSFLGNKIQQTFFHRNRLGFVSEGNIILSQAGDLGNFWHESALTVANNDPIDIAVSSTVPVKLRDSIETNTGLVIFGDSQQFLLHTDSDTLTPETAKISRISTYRFSPSAQPVSLGTTIGFVDNAGDKGRFFEMFDLRTEGEPQIVDTTKVVPNLLPSDIDLTAISRENGLILFSKIGTADLFGYRYINIGDQRQQAAWFKWTLPHNIKYLFALDDIIYVVSNDQKLLSIRLRNDDTARNTLGQNYFGDDRDYKVHLDSSEVMTAGAFDGTFTTVSWPTAVGTGTAAAVNTTTGDVYIQDSVSGDDYKFRGNFAGQSIVIGFLFDMEVDFPKLFVKKEAEGKVIPDVSASLTIQRLKLRFGEVGSFDISVRRLGKDTFTQNFSSIRSDFYEAGKAPFAEEVTKDIPIYERNKNFDLTLTSTHPGPATLYSLTWEGDYSAMYHNRV